MYIYIVIDSKLCILYVDSSTVMLLLQNLSIVDILGHVLIREVSSFHGCPYRGYYTVVNSRTHTEHCV